jgi:hypothetical protein
MSRLFSLNLILNLSIVKGSKCQSCVQSKQSRKPHKTAEERHLTPLELIHFNICEMNDMSRYCYVYLLKTKYEALNYFKIYKAEVENQLEKKIKRFRSDRGGEYFSNVFDLFCVEYGIIHKKTLLYSPQSNGVAKRKNCALTDLYEEKTPYKEWIGRKPSLSYLRT